jgi:hypothetical protein
MKGDGQHIEQALSTSEPGASLLPLPGSVWYPGTRDRSEALAVSVQDADDVSGLDLSIPNVGSTWASFVVGRQCKVCHAGAGKGQIYEVWEASAHAGAFESLGKQHREVDLCLPCNVTGDGRASRSPQSSLLGVQCEACHGPGSEYKAMSAMRDSTRAFQLGLIRLDEPLCRSCHRASLLPDCWSGHPNSPGFDYAAAWRRIEHGR